MFKLLRGEKIKGEAFDPLYKLSRLHLDQHNTTICQLDAKSKGFSLNEDYYKAIRNHLKIVYNQLPQDLQDELLKQSNDKEQQQQRQPPTTQTFISRPNVRKIDLEDEDTLMDTPQQPPPSSPSTQQQQQPPQQQQQPPQQQQQPPQQQQQPLSSSRQQQQQSSTEQLSQQQLPQQQPAAQSIVHSVPDDANLNDTLLQHCNLLADQMSSIAAAAAAASTQQEITLQLHLPIGAADLNIRSLEAICKLASLQSSVDISDYLWGKNYFWYCLSPKLIKSRTTSLKPDGFCMYRAIVAIQKLQSAEEEGNGRSSYVDLDLTKAEDITELLSCVQRVEERASIDLSQQRCKHLTENEIKEIKFFAQQAISLLNLQLEGVSNWKRGDRKIEAPVLLPVSIAEGDEEQLYPADESLFVSDIQSVVVYSTAFGSKKTTIGPSAHLVSLDTLVTKCSNLNIDDIVSMLSARNNLINDGNHYNLFRLDIDIICNALSTSFEEMVQALYDNKKKIVEMAHGALVALQKIIIDIGVEAATEWEHYAPYESLVLEYFNNSLGALPDLVSTRFEDACTTYQPFYNLLSHRKTLFEYPPYVQVSPHFV